MGLSEIIYMKQSGKIHPEASLFDILFTRKMGQDSITTATGNPVSIVTNKAQNAISTILSYSPKQSGSGDPSPQNIRPIEGWTEANLGVNSETPTITANLGGTYYGFSIDVERGVLRCDRAIVDLGSLDWTYSTSGNYPSFRATVTGLKYVTTSGQVIKAVCSCYKAVSFNDNVGRGLDFAISNRWNNEIVCVTDSNYNDKDTFTTAVTGQKLVYELATPIELPLTPQTVALLAGNNTLWTDGDSITITYRR